MLDVALAERSGPGLRGQGERAEVGRYEYIIVGAGPAGCVIADRLSAAGDARLLVLEAGATAFVHEAIVPSLFPRLIGSARDWSYPAEPETGLDFRKSRLRRARLAGGMGSFD